LPQLQQLMVGAVFLLGCVRYGGWGGEMLM
jgi:hypothetical protein